jgi:hypothetical protein
VWCVQLNVPKIEDGNNFGARAHGCALDSHRDESSVAAATSAPGPGLGSPCHICTGTALPPLRTLEGGRVGHGRPPMPHLH